MCFGVDLVMIYETIYFIVIYVKSIIGSFKERQQA